MDIPLAVTPELMDDPARSQVELRANFRDLARMNRLLGSHAFVRGFMDAALAAWRRGEHSAPLTVLDVATGGADVPAAVSRWGRRRGVPVRVVGVDRHPTIARIAATVDPAVEVVRADAAALPFRPRSFDVCLCTLALHHLRADQRAGFLARLDALARLGIFVVDLLRCPAGYGSVWLLTRLSRSRLTRHDGPLSVRRAMSWSEYRRCLEVAAIPGLRLKRLPFFRVAIVKVAAP